MPFYEYQCTQCNAITEVLQPLGSDQPPACSTCGSAATRKVMSAAGAQMAAAKKTPPPSCGSCRGGSCGL